MIIITRYFHLIIIISLFAGSLSFADERDMVKHQREGYSYFGLGYDFLDYEESTTQDIANQTVDVETVISANITQQSGAFVVVNSDWGFYLATASTMGSSSVQEEWKINETVIRENRVSFERERLGILATNHSQSRGYFLFGGEYGSTQYTRFVGKLTAGAQKFNIDENTFSNGSVAEKVWYVTAMLGYEVNTLHSRKADGWRYQGQAIIGIPLVASITNTELEAGKSYTDYFNGFQVRINGTLGYQFSKHMIAGIALEYGYMRRKSLNKNIIDNSGAVSKLPETVVMYLYPRGVVSWSF